MKRETGNRFDTVKMGDCLANGNEKVPNAACEKLYDNSSKVICILYCECTKWCLDI